MAWRLSRFLRHAFLSDVPARWIQRRRATPHTLGWAPFAGKLSITSRRQAIGIVAAMFAGLTGAKYLRSDPWALVSKKVNDDRTSVRGGSPTSKAFTPEAWQALMNALRPPGEGARPERSPLSRERFGWLCTVCEATGLRATELLTRVRGDVRMTRAGALLSVMGKGSKHWEVPLPKVALEATRAYFALRRMAVTFRRPGVDSTPVRRCIVLISLPSKLEPISTMANVAHALSGHF